MRHIALRDEVHLVTAGSALTLDEARGLADQLHRRLRPGTSHIVLDLTATRLAALPALVVALRTTRAAMAARRGCVTVVAPPERHALLRRITVLDEVLTIEPTLGDALAEPRSAVA